MRRTISLRGFAVSAALLGAMVAFGATIQAQTPTTTPDPTINAISTLQAETSTPDPTLQAISTSMVSGTVESTVTPIAMGTETVTVTATEVSGGTATPDATSTAVDDGTGTPTTTAIPTSESTGTPLATSTSEGTTGTPVATSTSADTTTATPTPASTVSTTLTPEPTTTVTATLTSTPVPGGPSNRTITVDGVGQANAVPDQAVVVLGVQTTAVTASVALSENNAIVRDLINVLTAGGVLSEDIQTQNLSLYAITNQPQNTTDIPRLVGFNVNNNVTVRIRNLGNLGTLLDQAVTAGANTIQSIQFELSDPEAQLQQARVEAINNARTKAQQLAGLANGSLGAIIAISESSSGFPVPLAARDGMGGSAVPIEPGRQSVQITVQVTWQLQ